MTDSSDTIPIDVSVVVPTRNRSALLALALRSVLSQRDVGLEVIVVDEASTDDTLAVLGAFGDARIRVVRHSSAEGVSAARNHGVAVARGEWVAFLDDDDLWAPDKLSLQLQAARQSGATWVYVGHVNINMRHQVTGGEPPLAPDVLIIELPRQNVVPGGCSGVMVSKQAFTRAGQFDPALQPLADWDLWLRLAEAGVPAAVARPLVAYRLHGRQMSLDGPRVEADFRTMTHRNRTGDPAVLFRYLGWWALRVGNHRRALIYFVRGWSQKRSASALRLLATDLGAVGRDALGRRLGMRWLQQTPRAPLSDAQHAWRTEGRAWVEGLIASQDRHAAAGTTT